MLDRPHRQAGPLRKLCGHQPLDQRRSTRIIGPEDRREPRIAAVALDGAVDLAAGLGLLVEQQGPRAALGQGRGGGHAGGAGADHDRIPVLAHGNCLAPIWRRTTMPS